MHDQVYLIKTSLHHALQGNKQLKVCLFAFQVSILVFTHFYRAMHFSAKRGIAIACRLSVRLSVRL